MKTQHTPTPWIVTKGNLLDNFISEKNGSQTIAETRNLQGNAKANAAHIVKCVNLHDELVEAFEHALYKAYPVMLPKHLKDLLKRAKGGE